MSVTCGGIRWDDLGLGIPFLLNEYDIEGVIMTEKDKNWSFLANYKKSIGLGWEK